MRMLASIALVTALVAGCTSADPADADRLVLAPATDGAGHTHAPGEEHAASGPLGDGTTPRAGGYEIADVVLPDRIGSPGELSFRILGEDGEPLTEYVEEQTKLLHLYVVRTDLAEFRHLHPDLGSDGTWTSPVTLPTPGGYRVVAEFVPGGTEQVVALGAEVTVPGDWTPTEVDVGPDAAGGTDGVISVTVAGASVGPDERMTMLISGPGGTPVELGTYLGAYAHVTGFHISSGRYVHTHPLGAPEHTDGGTELAFHTSFEEAGDLRFFVQVRVDGFVHQVPVTGTVVSRP